MTHASTRMTHTGHTLYPTRVSGYCDNCAALTEALDQVQGALSAASKLLADFHPTAEERAGADPPERWPGRDDALQLTPRELEVLGRVAEGKSNRQVAVCLGIAEKTVKNHLSAIFAKTGAVDRTQAVMRGIRGGLITVEG